MKKCYWCSKKLKSDGSGSYSILTFDKDYKTYQGRPYCRKCARILHRVILINMKSELGGIFYAITELKNRFAATLKNCKKI